ncbi:type II secretion system protein GspK [Sphingomonas sp.]|uniref:general secretion pathway protein GspK n=1 Tax=Sphingomonas sp. TaxID=28214 RepID=UPI001B2F63E9|nr:type II secretion system protein GspK [Sphingomonas sp.]MBO9714884.1 general secretion pathway protein GspK [Sphingomonas sp.]
MSRAPKPGEEGMILVNVLMFVAIAAGLVLLMINREELSLDRGLRVREATRAVSAMRGGELSAIVALRRDAVQAPQEDYPAEGWGAITETGAPIDGGTFDLAISDAEGRYNINNVRSGDVSALLQFTAIARSLGLEDAQIQQAVAYVRLAGPISDLRPVSLAGLDAEALARFNAMVTALPTDTTVNLNAASEPLLAILFNDADVAHRLVEVRKRQGHLSPKDLLDANISLPWGTSFRSNSYWVRARATIGGTSQQEAVLILRRKSEKGDVEAVPVARWRNAAIPAEAPAFGEKR